MWPFRNVFSEVIHPAITGKRLAKAGRCKRAISSFLSIILCFAGYKHDCFKVADNLYQQTQSKLISIPK